MANHIWLGDEDLGVFDPEKLTTTDALMIEVESAKIGRRMTLKTLNDELLEAGAAATITLVWFLRFKQGRGVDIRTIDFVFAELRGEEEPDPTTASSGDGDVNTSQTSPISSI